MSLAIGDRVTHRGRVGTVRMLVLEGARALVRFEQPHVFDGVLYPSYETHIDIGELQSGPRVLPRITAGIVAALYVDPRGCYAGMDGVELWDEERDARKYDSPHPVVAHPPCGRWCRLAHAVEGRYGYKVGDDGGTFEAALGSVRDHGGVLEHPAWTKAWEAYKLRTPWRWGGWHRRATRSR